MKRIFALVFITCFILSEVYGGRQLEILHADKLTMTEIDGKRARLLQGNVGLKHQETTLYSDKAYFYTDVNRVDAIGNVRIIGEEDATLYADSVFYFGDTRLAQARENVVVRDGEMTLSTPELDYDMERKIARFRRGGKMNDGEMQLTSRRGLVNTETNHATFFEDVIVIDPEYTLFADTLGYNTRTETATFYKNTRIVTSGQVIYCNSGTFNVKSRRALFGSGTRVEAPPQRLLSDSLKYNIQTGEGTTYRKFEWSDSVEQLVITGHYGEYHRESGYLMATQRPMLKANMDNDTLYIVSDTLIAGLDTADNRFFNAFYQSRFFRTDLQGFADSISYTNSDSVIRMFRNPALWQNETQLSADTIFITLREQKLYQIDLHANAYILEYDAPEVYNQIRGRNIFGHFEDDELRRMEVVGNAESIYFGKDESNRYVGVNRALSSNMSIHFAEGNVERIHFLQSPEAGFYPLQGSRPEEYRLDGFNWRGAIRPLSIEDLLNPLTKPEVEPDASQKERADRQRSGRGGAVSTERE